jgi:hypothetical protein
MFSVADSHYGSITIVSKGDNGRPPKLAIKNDTLHILGKFHNFEGLSVNSSTNNGRGMPTGKYANTMCCVPHQCDN